MIGQLSDAHDKVAPAVCAGVVKADAKSGLVPVARRLWREGCRVLCRVPEEGIALRGILAEAEICRLTDCCRARNLLTGNTGCFRP